MIPLEGARVRVRVGKRTGQEGYADLVRDGHEKIRQMDPLMVPTFIALQRASFGEHWMDFWYEAVVRLDDGSLDTFLGRDLEVLEPDMLRPEGYRRQR